MLLDFEEAIQRFGMDVRGILHIGANLAQEAPIYQRVTEGSVTWVEAEQSLIPTIHATLTSYPNQRVILALISDTDGDEVEFKITNYDSMSSSIFEFGTHPTFSPDTVVVERRMLRTTTVNRLMRVLGGFDDINTLVMDIQGAELKALKGATNLLPQIDYVYTEVNSDDVYVGCAKVEELDEFLIDFRRVATHWVGAQGWGDALFCRHGTYRA